MQVRNDQNTDPTVRRTYLLAKLRHCIAFLDFAHFEEPATELINKAFDAYYEETKQITDANLRQFKERGKAFMQPGDLETLCNGDVSVQRIIWELQKEPAIDPLILRKIESGDFQFLNEVVGCVMRIREAREQRSATETD